MKESPEKIGIIILAAGASRRFGEPKQLLQFEGKTLIRRAVEAALETEFHPVIAVLGANFEPIKNEIENYECEVVFNPVWQTGMSSSIKKGLKKLLEIAPDISAVIFALPDQPLVKSEHFKRLTEKFFATEKSIIASVYGDTIGVPAFFAKVMFPALLKLEADKGAQQIIKNDLEAVEKVSVPEAAFDIDTKADFEKFQKSRFK